jgi:hypothetical protein
MKVILSKELEKFLKDNSLYERFIKNVEKNSFKSRDYYIELNSIHKAFIWMLTPEGHLFWSAFNSIFEQLKKEKES